MRLIWLVCGALDVNTYIIGADDTKDCIVIDPGEAAPVLECLEREQLNCTHILITHGHFDHIGGAAQVQAQTGAKLCIHTDDAEKLSSNRASLSTLAGRPIEKTKADILLHDGETIDAAGLHILALHTPGHYAGSLCYVVESERVIFCGDTIFCGDAGRTDFPGCSERVLYRSIVDKLYSLSGDYTLYCGHDEQTTLDNERATNSFTTYGARMGW